MHQNKKTFCGEHDGRTNKFTNVIRWVSPHRVEARVDSDASLANRTRPSREKIPYSELVGRPHTKLQRRLNKLHSIPIKRSFLIPSLKDENKNKQLRKFSYSIPLVCMLALFGLFCIASSVGDDSGLIVGEAYAAEGEEKPTYNPSLTMSLSGQICSDEDKGIGCEVYGQTVANVGETTYSRAYGVNINGQDMSDYKLTISANNGGALINDGEGDGNSGDGSGGANIPSVASTSGEAMGENTWGYAWFDSSSVTDEEKKGSAYKALSGTQTTLKSEQSIEASEINVDGSLVFAAKFGDEMPSGHYKTEVILSLTASPKKTSLATGFAGIYYMQDMTPTVCANAGTAPVVGQLEDKRDGSLYTIAKINNKTGGGANCWMTQNLQLDLEQYWNAETMVTSLSDVPSDDYWTQRSIGAATKKNQGFTQSTSNYNAIEYTNTTTTGSGEDKLKVASGTYNADYGYYYTWCAATVGCKDNSGANPAAGVEAVASICPKGWQLPSGNTNGQWYNLLNGMNMTSVAAEPYKIPAAGSMNSDGFNYGGALGGYWSRTAGDANDAYTLYFSSSNFLPGTNSFNRTRYNGYSVRCVAEVATKSSGFSGIYYMQDMTPTVCANAGTAPVVGQLEDRRDGSLYTIAKINNKVGGGANCWMTQNLALDLEQYWNKETMVMSLSDVPSDDYWTQRSIGAATKKNQGFTISSSNYNAIEYTNTTTTGSAENQLKINSGTYDPSYGYYYTWCAAMVGCKDNSGANPAAGVEAVASICPKGWQLPSGNTNGQWYNLLNGMNMTSVAAELYKIPAAGSMNSAGFVNGGTDGIYWSRTASVTNNAYGLYFYSSNFYPGTYSVNRYVGYSVRCVAKP